MWSPDMGFLIHYFPFISYKKLLLNFHSIQVNESVPPEFKLCFLFYHRSLWSKKKLCEHIQYLILNYNWIDILSLLTKEMKKDC